MLIGIDLGTTNSAVAVWEDGEARLVPNALDAELTPSAVSIDAQGQVWLGAPALDRRAIAPQDTATSFKRLMGTAATASLGGSLYRAEDLSALVLGALVADVEARTGRRPSEAVITVPAYFNDRQRKATRQAGELAGLKVTRLINEPTAAALAFGLADKGDREPFLVFDLGGGTFDVSIVEMFEGIVEVRASAGDNRLGGDDFDAALATLVRPRLDPDRLLDALPAEQRDALLGRAAQECRKALSTASEAEFSLVCDKRRMSTTVTDSEFEAACTPLLDRLRDPVVRALRDSQIDASELSEIVLVGGATRMPVVRRAITRLFGRFPNATVHPDHAVALGAAIQAGLAGRDAALSEIRITDVCPYTLGVEVAEQDGFGGIQRGLFSPIIERNTPVPVSRMQSYSTLGDAQKKIEFAIAAAQASKQMDILHRARIVRADLTRLQSHDEGRRRQALQDIKDALSYAAVADCYRLRIEASASLARHMRIGGDYDTALRYGADAMTIAARYGHSLQKTSLRIELGRILDARGDPVSGKALLDQAIAIGTSKGYNHALERVRRAQTSIPSIPHRTDIPISG